MREGVLVMRIAHAAIAGLVLAATLSEGRAQERAPAVPMNSPVPAPVVGQVPQALADLVERAWQLSRQATAKGARAVELSAREAATRTFFAGAPAVSLDLRRDLPRDAGLPGTDASPERGKNEWEPGFSAPIWLPGQRDAQRRVIAREREVLSAQAQLVRWQLAGEVRDIVWRLGAARVEVAAQRARLDAARALEADVARRQRMGDLARADLWMAQAETRAASAAALEAGGRLAEAQASLAAITGLEESGDVQERPAALAALDDGHPGLRAVREAAEAARSRLAYAQVTRRDNPTFNVVGRFDRDAYGGPYRNTVRFGFAVPLATEARNAPRITAAAAEATEQEIELERERRRIGAEQRRAAVSLEAARSALDEHIERARLARDTFEAIERAFRAGERGLPELLRVRAMTLDAELARELARNQVGAAIARLNQAAGDTP